MRLFDTHCHLDCFLESGRLNDVLHAASNAHVHAIMTIGTNPKDWPVHAEIANQQASSTQTSPHIYYTLGLHPTEIGTDWPITLETLEHLLLQAPKRLKAMGEIGLDYKHCPSNSPRQLIQTHQDVFYQQLLLANRFSLPIVIHCRDAFQDCLHIIEKAQCDWTKILFHCFTGTPEEAKKLQERGAKVSFSGIVTFKKAQTIQESLKALDIEHVLIETDAPFLAPEPKRGQENEPALLSHVASFCSQFLNIPHELFCERVWRNSLDFYQLSNTPELL